MDYFKPTCTKNKFINIHLTIYNYQNKFYDYNGTVLHIHKQYNNNGTPMCHFCMYIVNDNIELL